MTAADLREPQDAAQQHNKSRGDNPSVMNRPIVAPALPCASPSPAAGWMTCHAHLVQAPAYHFVKLEHGHFEFMILAQCAGREYQIGFEGIRCGQPSGLMHQPKNLNAE